MGPINLFELRVRTVIFSKGFFEHVSKNPLQVDLLEGSCYHITILLYTWVFYSQILSILNLFFGKKLDDRPEIDLLITFINLITILF